MKITCDACGVAAAQVVCCVDDTAFCGNCDLKVHATPNTDHHQRLHLLPNSTMPKCDVCREALGYFFCIEHRQMLCTECEIDSHKLGSLQDRHRRILITGVEVGREAEIVEHEAIYTDESSNIFYPGESSNMFEFFEFGGNTHEICDWSTILQSDWSSIFQSIEELANADAEGAVNISQPGPEFLAAHHPVHDLHTISDNNNNMDMDMDFNGVARLP